MKKPRKKRRPPERTEQGFVLRVFRIDEGEEVYFRTISHDYGGLLTHYKGVGHYCPGASSCTMHSVKMQWKGYACVDIWDPVFKSWIPWVLEITENAELDMRGRWRRGQVWRLKLPKDVPGREVCGVRAEYVEDCKIETLPQPFDFSANLFWIYRANPIVLDQPNPMPPRKVLKPAEAAPPPGHTGKDGQARPEDRGNWREVQRQKKLEEAEANGNGNGQH